ncbi:hypothetical protein [Endozoicomonas sp.]|uniref:hypothetical protein n=1 Tax=Endozoicomonas sp. TaxID=1892382 RepID=UPI0028837B65|nr:hypothetical protein [Endozoicomonas sp.]
MERSINLPACFGKSYVESCRATEIPVDERRKALASDVRQFLNTGGVIKVLPPAGDRGGIIRVIEQIREAKQVASVTS